MVTKDKVHQINQLSNEYIESGDIGHIHTIERLAQDIIDNF